MKRVAIIGGTGLEQLPPDYETERLTIKTDFGESHPILARRTTETGTTQEFLFLSRHGEQHGIAPHRIPYRANIRALVELGVEAVLATNAVGSLRLTLPPRSLVLMSDFIDFTHTRPASYWDDVADAPEPVIHTDFSEPYSPRLRAALLAAAERLAIPLVPYAVYLCAEGPRFESPAEVRLFGQWGADIVGMTGLPEATFAREAGLAYAAIGIVTNYGAGLTAEKVQHEDVLSVMNELRDPVRLLLLSAAGTLAEAQ